MGLDPGWLNAKVNDLKIATEKGSSKTSNERSNEQK
jgi:hypothetical protein